MRRSNTMQSIAPRWSVAANIVAERPYGPLGLERRAGTSHFRPGAKVWVIDWFPGMCMNVIVIGHHRGSHRLVKLVASVRHTEDWRAKLIYSPAVLTMLEEHFGDEALGVTTRDEANTMCGALAAWRDAMRPAPFSQRGEVIARVSRDRLRVMPLGDGDTLDRSTAWDIPAPSFPADSAHVGARVVVERDDEGEIRVLAGP